MTWYMGMGMAPKYLQIVAHAVNFFPLLLGRRDGRQRESYVFSSVHRNIFG